MKAIKRREDDHFGETVGGAEKEEVKGEEDEEDEEPLCSEEVEMESKHLKTAPNFQNEA